ncbi:histone-lysine N-methyltransferase SETDB1-B-like [Genypterus blacodes]|uniref:histone-lysine N-methyltransferase SETDB1-B-like n=1 Tax=Genypterus blacodes TaxID=154954 RepID=UPI003F7639CF
MDLWTSSNTSVSTMEDDEVEVTKEELQKLVKEIVDKNSMDSPRLLSRYSLLQCLLKRREKDSEQLLKLCESVEECETLVRTLYSQLGWEYRDTDSEEEGNEDGNWSQTKALNSVKRECLRRNPVVVLTRLPESTICALLPSPSQLPPPEQSPVPSPLLLGDSGDESSDLEWFDAGSELSSDSDSSTSQSMPNKKRRKDCTTGQLNGSNTNSVTQVNETMKSNNNGATQTNKAIDQTIGLQAASVFSNLIANKNTKEIPKMPHQQITVNMKVVAKRNKEWERGTVAATVEKDDGRIKYKVAFASKGKIQVSGHHIAADESPIPDDLRVGARVVVQSKGNKSCFRSGILAETPIRKNCKRFLVLMDDHTPVYVEPILLRCICMPLEDVWDDISDITHKKFMWFYLKAWPYQPMNLYKVGQAINVERCAVQKPCKVVMLDCSLIQIVFEDDNHEEWIYRGSIRIGDMAKLKERMDES